MLLIANETNGLFNSTFFKTIVNILSFLTSWGPGIDIFIFVLLLIGFILGLVRKTWFSLVHFIITYSILLIFYAFFLNPLSTWFVNDAFAAWNYAPSFSMSYGGNEIKFTVHSFYELVTGLVSYSPFVNQSTTIFTKEFCYSLSLGIARAAFMFVAVLLLPLLSSLVTPAFLPLLKLLIGKSKVKKANSRLFGGIIGLVGMFITLSLISSTVGALGDGFTVFFNNPNGIVRIDQDGKVYQVLSNFNEVVLKLFYIINPQNTICFKWLSIVQNLFVFKYNGLYYNTRNCFNGFASEVLGCDGYWDGTFHIPSDIATLIH